MFDICVYGGISFHWVNVEYHMQIFMAEINIEWNNIFLYIVIYDV